LGGNIDASGAAGDREKVKGEKQGAGSGEQGARETADGAAESARQPIGKPAATLNAEMGKRSREIVAKFSCENFAKQAMGAAGAASA
jgi:hypothetical protein